MELTDDSSDPVSTSDFKVANYFLGGRMRNGQIYDGSNAYYPEIDLSLLDEEDPVNQGNPAPQIKVAPAIQFPWFEDMVAQADEAPSTDEKPEVEGDFANWFSGLIDKVDSEEEI